MDNAILVAIISMIGTLGGSFLGVITSTKLSNYRIEQLEKKVDKHNSVVERTYALETKVNDLVDIVDEVKEYVKTIDSR